jgi:cytochrome c-type biogenesis protein
MLAGVLTALVAVALVLNALAVPSTDLLRVVVPLVDGLLILLGVLLISGRNPFERLPGITVPVVRNPLGQAYLYGLLLGPVALPCAGPFVLALLAISVGIEDTTLRLGSFLVYGLGFGAPLVLLSFVAAARRQALMGVVLRHHEMIMWLAGVALVAAGLYDLAATIRSA